MIKNLLLGNFQCLNIIVDHFCDMLISIQLKEICILLIVSIYMLLNVSVDNIYAFK